jgi:hypothetical protein
LGDWETGNADEGGVDSSVGAGFFETLISAVGVVSREVAKAEGSVV